jgi:hypothetical protein
VLVTDSDGMSFGARYLQAALGVRPDVPVIVEGRLASSWGWAQARALLPALPVDVPPEQRLRALFDTARAEGRAIVAGNDAAAPTGVVRRPLGIAWVWLLPDEVPQDAVLVERILTACARLPDAITAVDDARPSTVVARNLWLTPLVNARRAQLPSEAIGRALDQIAAGDVVAARATCSTALVP